MQFNNPTSTKTENKPCAAKQTRFGACRLTEKKAHENTTYIASSLPRSVTFIPALPCAGLPSLGRSHSDAPAFNSEQQLRRERHMAGKSRHWGLEYRGQLDCGWPAQWVHRYGNVRVLQYNRRLPLAQYGGQRYRVQRGRERVYDHR